MKEVINLLPLSSYLSTSYHVREVTKSLDRLQSSMFHRNQPFLKTLEQEISFPLSETLAKLAISNEVNLDDLEEVDRFLSMLRDNIQIIPRMTLTLTFEPTLDLIRDINEWITVNLQAAIILDFEIDKSLIGGAKVAYNGKIVDHSLRKRVETMMKSSTGTTSTTSTTS